MSFFITNLILSARINEILNPRIMTKNIYPSIWFDNQAKEAAEFYISTLGQGHILQENPIVVSTQLYNFKFIGINGGDQFRPNASISFMLIGETKEEIDSIWKQFSTDGSIMMPLDSYPWSEYYGWVADRYGVNWQLYLGKLDDVNNQKIVPTLMFGQSQQGRCEEAIRFYKTVFTDFQGYDFLRYTEGPFSGQIQHTQFNINDILLMAMDSGVPQDFSFTEGVSFVLECADQSEIDYYWDAFTKDGQESMCGWCKDPFGVSWQVVPHNLKELLFEASNATNATNALRQMKKIDLDTLRNA